MDGVVLHCQHGVFSSGPRVRIAGSLMGLIALFPAAYAQPADSTGMNAASIEEMLNAHNELRRARQIRPLKWSFSLAESAQQWADHLAFIGVMEHNLRLRAGQNLYVIRGATTRPALVVRRWAEEARDYRESENYCRPGAVCGHFTQIIWAGTEEVGCGVAGGKRGQFWVCFYLPPGNVVGQKPY